MNCRLEGKHTFYSPAKKPDLCCCFFRTLAKMSERDYLLAKITCESAPLLLGIKPSCLISLQKCNRNLYQLWQQHHQELIADLGIHCFEMARSDNHLSLLLYHPAQLEKILSDYQHREFLVSQGYDDSLDLEKFLNALREKFLTEIPHEIGLLLGIPLTDMQKFMEKQGNDYLFCGYWKVYDNPFRAGQIFQSFDNARLKWMEMIAIHDCTIKQGNLLQKVRHFCQQACLNGQTAS